MASPEGVCLADVVEVAAGDAAVDRAGPGVRLCPGQAGALALVVAELISNSRRHGALSRGGRVRVSWECRAGERREGGGWLELVCEEEGGVGMRGAAPGVGLRLAEELSRVDLRGSLRVGECGGGVRCVLHAEVDDVQGEVGQDEGR
jgi:two-component sensor histidine kinase